MDCLDPDCPCALYEHNGFLAEAFIKTASDMAIERLRQYAPISNYKNTKENKAMSYCDEDSKIPTPEQRLASEAEAIASESPENARIIKQAAEKAENAYRQRVQKALKGCADLELLKEPQGRRFVLALLQNGTVEISHGINYVYGQGIEDDDKYKEKRVFVAGHLVGCGAHYSMEDLGKNLDNRGFTYHIEYHPDQD